MKNLFSPIEGQLGVLIDSRWKLLNLIFVKTLKMLIQEIFLLTDNKNFFENCKSVIVLTTPNFLVQPKII